MSVTAMCIAVRLFRQNSVSINEMGKHYFILINISQTTLSTGQHMRLSGTDRYFSFINKNTHRHGYSLVAEPEKERAL